MKTERELQDIANYIARTECLDGKERLAIAIELITNSDVPVRPKVVEYLREAIENKDIQEKIGKLKPKNKRVLLTEQIDDDDGVERVTPAGSIVEIDRFFPPDSYLMGCPANGATWFFTGKQVVTETREL